MYNKNTLNSTTKNGKKLIWIIFFQRSIHMDFDLQRMRAEACSRCYRHMSWDTFCLIFGRANKNPFLLKCKTIFFQFQIQNSFKKTFCSNICEVFTFYNFLYFLDYWNQQRCNKTKLWLRRSLKYSGMLGKKLKW